MPCTAAVFCGGGQRCVRVAAPCRLPPDVSMMNAAAARGRPITFVVGDGRRSITRRAGVPGRDTGDSGNDRLLVVGTAEDERQAHAEVATGGCVEAEVHHLERAADALGDSRRVQRG